jgi:catechol 2,3-dioxygenase-like lactoylglutathione lyase family enzyme
MWWGTAIEAPDPAALARFYSRLLDWPVVHQDNGTFVIKPPQESVFIVFQAAEDYVPPVWPTRPGEQRTMMHLDVEVHDLDAAIADAVSLGAQIAEYQPQENVRVLLDPAGHPFCLCVDQDQGASDSGLHHQDDRDP